MTTRTPARRPVAAWPAILIALALVALAAVGIRELAVALGWVQGDRWIGYSLDWADNRERDVRVIAVGIVAVLLGLAMLYTVIRPASRTHVLTTSTDPEIWISRKAVSALAEQALERVPGVHRAKASTRRRLAVRASVIDPDAADRVQEALNQSVGPFLAQSPRVTIRKASL